MPTITSVPDFSAGYIFGLLANIGDWIFIAGLLIVPVMIVIGAVFLLSGGDNPNRLATARKIFIWTVVGLALMLLSKGIFSAVRDIFGA